MEHEPIDRIPPTPENPALPGDIRPNSPEFDLHMKTVEKTAANLLHFLEIEKERAAIDNVVFSLHQSIADMQAKNPLDFSDMLTTNARILNAAFEYYLDKAHHSPAADHKIVLAMKMQGQLTRTIDAWRRLADFQNRVTK